MDAPGRRWMKDSELLIRGFGVQVPGGAPVVTWCFPLFRPLRAGLVWAEVGQGMAPGFRPGAGIRAWGSRSWETAAVPAREAWRAGGRGSPDTPARAGRRWSTVGKRARCSLEGTPTLDRLLG